MDRTAFEPSRPRSGPAVLLASLTLLVAAAVALSLRAETEAPAAVLLAALGAAATAYVAWSVHPAHVLIAGFVLSPFAGWSEPWLHVPGALAPHRLLLVAAVAGVAVRAPAMRRRAPLTGGTVLVALGVASAYALVSALLAGTLTDKDEFFRLVEGFGLIPFAVFAVAPAAFVEARHRDELLAAAVLVGAYLGLTALFETVGPSALIYPRYILDPTLGIHVGRARGPFLEAVTNGTALYLCGVLSVVAIARWRSTWPRLLALATMLLCAGGIVFTLQRSVWLGAIVATLVAGLARRDARRILLPLLLVAAIGGSAAYAALPSGTLRARVTDSETVWARKNINRAALNLFETQPLIGVGWGQFVPRTQFGEFFQQDPDFPLTGVGNVVHNQFLSNAVELGLIGAGAWLLALVLAVAGGVRSRSPDGDLRAWKTAFLAFAVFFAIVSTATPTHVFTNLAFWLIAGVAWSDRAGVTGGRGLPTR